MITLYHCANARSFRVLWILEELGLSYLLQMLRFPPRVFHPAYLKANPLGTVPLLVDGDTRMTESAAICQYLAGLRAPTPLNVERDEASYGAYLEGLHFGEASLTFPLTLVLRYKVLEPEERRVPQAAEDYALFFFGRLRALEWLLEKQDFVCTDRFTAADISIGYALLLAKVLGLHERFTPRVQQYWQRLSSRPGFQRASAAQEAATLEQGTQQLSVAGVGIGAGRLVGPTAGSTR